MPHEFKKYTIAMQDGRRKLDPALYDQIRAEYKAGGTSWRKLADKYGVNKKIIGFVLSERMRETQKNYNVGRWKIYADKDEHREAMRKYRAKKKSLGIETKENKSSGGGEQ